MRAACGASACVGAIRDCDPRVSAAICPSEVRSLGDTFLCPVFESSFMCDNDGRPIALSLPFALLAGSLSTEIGRCGAGDALVLGRDRFLARSRRSRRLSTLKRLSLESNLLVGTIPSQIGLLTQLTTLLLSNNRLTGTVLLSATALAATLLSHRGARDRFQLTCSSSRRWARSICKASATSTVARAHASGALRPARGPSARR